MNETVIQPMQNEHGIQKGVRTILLERGKPRNAAGHLLNMQCAFCRSKSTDDEREESRGWLDPICCGSYVISQEPDFMAQNEWLSEVVTEARFQIIFFPL